MQRNYTKTTLVTIIALSAAGCSVMPGTSGKWQTRPVQYKTVPQASSGYSGAPHEPEYMAYGEPSRNAPLPQAAAPQFNTAINQQQYAPAVPAANQQSAMQAQLVGQLQSLQERLERLERAMIKLDRRVQLIERNELGRMSGLSGQIGGQTGGQIAGQGGSLSPISMTPVASLQDQDMPAAQIPSAIKPMAGSGFQPVNMISSSLQAAPNFTQQGAVVQGSARRQLPSLADEAKPQQHAAETNVSIWTIEFEKNKVWPNREQLPASRGIIQQLQNSNGAAIFARGTRPTSKLFRERVRAVSRYLSKVSGMDNIAISTLPGEHLSSDTIEIFATY